MHIITYIGAYIMAKEIIYPLVNPKITNDTTYTASLSIKTGNQVLGWALQNKNIGINPLLIIARANRVIPCL